MNRHILIAWIMAAFTLLGIGGGSSFQKTNPKVTAYLDSRLAEAHASQPTSLGTIVQGWQQSNESGFGILDNSMISALAVLNDQMYATTWNEHGAQVWRTSDGASWHQFTPSVPFTTTVIYDAKHFGDYLYIGTYLDSGGEIWRTNGADWERVAANGVNDANNLTISAFAVFSNMLYAATGNFTTGVEIFRSATGNEASWTQVNSDGFGGGASWDAITMEVFGGYLYVGLSRSVGASGGLAELWRTNDGTTWEAVFTDGLGDDHNTHVSSIAEFDGNLYIGLRNTVSGGQVWRSANGADWTPVFTDGLGVSGNSRPYGLYVFEGQLYLVFSNYSAGAQIWRSADGSTWTQVMTGGWDDINNIIADYFDKAAVDFKDSLYVGSGNNAVGGQIWQLLHQLSLPVIMK